MPCCDRCERGHSIVMGGRWWGVLRADLARHGQQRGGFWALAVYRYGRWTLALNSPAARWLGSKVYGLANQGVKAWAGVDLDRRTTLGRELHFVRTGMIFIHPHAKVGDRVRIMHGVTIGTNMGETAPTIGNDVFIGCNASVLGHVTIGDGARVEANSLVVNDVPAGAVAVGVPARVIRPPTLQSVPSQAVGRSLPQGGRHGV